MDWSAWDPVNPLSAASDNPLCSARPSREKVGLGMEEEEVGVGDNLLASVSCFMVESLNWYEDASSVCAHKSLCL